MPAYKVPEVEVVALRGFMARAGHAVRPGERIKIATHVANQAIALGNARLTVSDDYTELMEEDPPDLPPAPEPGPREPAQRDPVPTHRDPARRRTR